MTIHDETQRAWESASQKHIREYDGLLAEARSARLFPVEEAVLGGVVPGADDRDAAGERTRRQLGRPRPGKGALIWVEDLGAWLSEMRRLLRPHGHLFIYEAHPLAPLWSWDPGTIEVRGDRGYFARTHVNDSFPAGGAVEFQRTLAETIMGITGAGFELLHLGEHAEPFWRPGGVAAAAWNGQVPNAFSLLARRAG